MGIPRKVCKLTKAGILIAQTLELTNPTDPARVTQPRRTIKRRARARRTELTQKQQVVYELLQLGLSFSRIAERIEKQYDRTYSTEAARGLYKRAMEVKRRKGASVQTRRPLALG